MQIDIIGYEKIEVAIAIVVEKSASRSPASIAFVKQPRLPGDIGKRAVSIVAVKNILTVVSDEDIFKTIIVIVTDGHSTGPTCAQQSGFFGDIGKRSIPIILVQAVAGIGNGLRPYAYRKAQRYPAIRRCRSPGRRHRNPPFRRCSSYG